MVKVALGSSRLKAADTFCRSTDWKDRHLSCLDHSDGKFHPRVLNVYLTPARLFNLIILQFPVTIVDTGESLHTGMSLIMLSQIDAWDWSSECLSVNTEARITNTIIASAP
jgi:hypothetical protein